MMHLDVCYLRPVNDDTCLNMRHAQRHGGVPGELWEHWKSPLCAHEKQKFTSALRVSSCQFTTARPCGNAAGQAPWLSGFWASGRHPGMAQLSTFR